MSQLVKIGLGGGCHWCTEAVFQSLIGVEKVEQGYIASTDKNTSFSEAIIVHFDPNKIDLLSLIEIHLHTHKSTSMHSMRNKYRSAVYVFTQAQHKDATRIINQLQPSFDNQVVTQVLRFLTFKASRESIQNYYQKNPDKPFCETYINPKIRLLLKKFSNMVTTKTKQQINSTTSL